MLKENVEDANYKYSDVYFLSAKTSSTYKNARPTILIAYRNQTGLEDYLSYHQQVVGRAGTVYTNDYNGNLTLIHDDLSTPGDKLPVSINHIYNTDARSNDGYGYGKGMRLNIAQVITIVSIDSKEYMRYIDEDGTVHYLLKNGSKYEDEDGLGLTGKKSGSNIVIEDKGGNKSTFTKYTTNKEKWHLSKIEDASRKLYYINTWRQWDRNEANQGNRWSKR